MKKFFVILFCVLTLTLVCGCENVKETNSGNTSEITVILPLDDTVNGYRQDEIKDSTQDSDTNVDVDVQSDGYYVNTKTKKFHKLSCIYAQKGSENGIWSESDRDTLINEGHLPCSKCKP